MKDDSAVMVHVGTIRFTTPLGGLRPAQRAALADIISAIAAEIRKGEHLACTEHFLQVAA